MKVKLYPKTKPSGVEWLGDVPEHWEHKRLGYLFRFFSGGTPSTSESELWDGDLPWVSSKDMKTMVITDTEDHISEDAVRLSAATKVPSGSLLMVNRSGILKHSIPVAVTLREMAINQDIRGCVPFSGTDAKFFAYLIHGNQKQLLPLWRQQGATVESLSFEAVKTSRLYIPPLTEQRTIAAYLDSETGRIDALVAKKRELIERLKEKRTALISRTVTRGLPPTAAKAAGLPVNPKMKDSGIEWLGEIPEHWEVKKLSWLFRYAKGPSAAMLTKEYIAENLGDYPVFSGQTENDGLMGMIDWHEFDFEKPVIFVTTVGARAMSTRMVSGKFSLSQNCALIIPRNTSTNAGYFESVLRVVFEYERGSISQIMQPSLRFEDLDRFRVPLPSPTEQTAITSYLDAETMKLDALVAKVNEAVERLQEFRTALITAAVTGKIDVRKEIQA
jgi:type I restriction enzyme, S subunit